MADPIWYDKVVVGEDTINKFMKNFPLMPDCQISTLIIPLGKHVYKLWMTMIMKKGI